MATGTVKWFNNESYASSRGKVSPIFSCTTGIQMRASVAAEGQKGEFDVIAPTSEQAENRPRRLAT